ncbi:hypothetical protein G3577_05975 [Morganella morganii]|uniref:hypothetical protein n=1 Tax=Morganella morganii TaxID=582 RepID=UPI0013A76EA2|nr:hypothetical protein [Morganella morganii]QIC11614.1 hypothetical protein G3577_05975 [Morganella morganii]
MEPTDFEKWCAGELGYEIEYLVVLRKSFRNGDDGYTASWVDYRYRAYMAGVRSRLPYQTPPKGDEDEMD